MQLKFTIMSTTAKKTVGVVGGSGYTGGELLRLLVNHPLVTIDFVYSSTRPGTHLTETHTDLIGQTDLKFTDEVNPNVDMLFLCLGDMDCRELSYTKTL